MALKVFVLFPENEALEADMLHSLDSDYQSVIKDFFSVLEVLKKRGDFEIYYDSENVASLINKNENENIYPVKDIQRLRVGLQKQNITDIKNTNRIDNQYFYFQWNLDNCSISHIGKMLKELTERKLNFPTEKNIFINLRSTITACRDRIFTFRDAKHSIISPDFFLHIEYVTDDAELDLWLSTHHIKKFSLFDKNKFVKTSKIVQGKSVYEELETGYFWYLDNFHKNHYEVFENLSTHLGEADLEGSIDRSKRDNTKTIN